jgi:hypothetical protein
MDGEKPTIELDLIDVVFLLFCTVLVSIFFSGSFKEPETGKPASPR